MDLLPGPMRANRQCHQQSRGPWILPKSRKLKLQIVVLIVWKKIPINTPTHQVDRLVITSYIKESLEARGQGLPKNENKGDRRRSRFKTELKD